MKYKALFMILVLFLVLSACTKGEQIDETLINNIYTQVDSNDNQSDGQLKVEIYSQGKPVHSEETDDFLKTITAETAEAKGVCGADLTWYYQDGVLVIKGTGEMNDYSQNTLPPWWMGDENDLIKDRISWIIVGDGVTSIGECAFASLPQLSKITLPETLTEIRSRALSVVRNLNEITIPSSVSLFGEYVFDNDQDFKTVTFLGDAPEGAEVVAYTMLYSDGIIYYSGSGFDELIEEFPDINWVKK